MKINWFSPLPPARTGIAAWTAALVPALQQQAEIVLWTSEREWDRELETIAEVRHFDPLRMDWRLLNSADHTIYNLGNHPIHHRSIWEISRQHAGIVILHDTRLQGFFAYLYREASKDPEEYASQMERYYGAEGERAAREFWRGPYTNAAVDRLAARFPLFPLALDNSMGVIVHSPESLQLVEQSGAWPVKYLPLAYRVTAPAGCRPPPRTDSEAPRVLIVVGHISPNRRLETLLNALAELEQKERLRLEIHGTLWDEPHVRSLIQSAGLADLVTIQGFTPEAELAAALDRADLAVNLRYPSMGEASLSQLQIWEHGLPSLVTRVGWFESLPENAVAFVRTENEVEDIKTHLREFLRSPDRYRRMGEQGRLLLERRHAPEGYVAGLMEFLSDGYSYSLRATALAMAERVAADMKRWLAPSALEPLLGKVTAEILALTAPRPK